MRCYCVTHHGKPLELLELPKPEPKGTEVLVRIEAAGLCHTDLHLWEGYYDLGGGKRLNLADRGIKPPLTLSHEISGVVVAAGDEAGPVEMGMHCLIHPWIGCGECPACKRGEENICTNGRSLGVIRPGGFADYVIVPHPRYLVDIQGIAPAEAAPLACAGVTTYSAINKLGSIIYDEPVVILGAGGLGLMAIEILKAKNAKGAIVVDINQAKRDAAMKAGAILSIDAKAPDCVQQIIKATNGGARAILDLVGATSTMETAINSSARGAHIVVCGLMGGDIHISLPIIPMRPLKIEGSYVGTLRELRELVELVKQTGLKAIPVTKRPMSEINAAFEDLHHGRVIGRTVLVP